MGLGNVTVSGNYAAGSGIGISGHNTIANSGVTPLVAGTGISVSAATGTVTVSLSSGYGGFSHPG